MSLNTIGKPFWNSADRYCSDLQYTARLRSWITYACTIFVSPLSRYYFTNQQEKKIITICWAIEYFGQRNYYRFDSNRKWVFVFISRIQAALYNKLIIIYYCNVCRIVFQSISNGAVGVVARYTEDDVFSRRSPQ